MEDNYEIQDTEIESNNLVDDGPTMRQSLQQNLQGSDSANTEIQSQSDEKQSATDTYEHNQTQVEERPILLPPADMRKEEKEAFLNPTQENAHILQSYLNRRAYETRADYSRKMAELEEQRKSNAKVYDAIKEWENDYAKDGIAIGDVARRSIAWDRAMQVNPIETAREWLDAYGLSLQDLYGQRLENQFIEVPPQGDYLTRQEAERIAEERMRAVMAQEEQKAVEYFNQKVVESFMNSKPVFKDPETASQIETEMAPIVQALTGTGRYTSPEQILETAYNYVINGNPAYSSLVQRMTAKPVIEKTQAVAQKAKAASRSISGSPGSGTPRLEVKDLRENLRRRMVGDD